MRTDLARGAAPVLVLGIGNPLLADDGVGLALLELLRRDPGDGPRVGADGPGHVRDVEFVDGGTQGLALLGLLERRSALLVLDAVQRGDAPGTVHVVREPQRAATPRGFGAHGGNASELLAAALLLGELPGRVHLVGVEPDELRTRVGLSRAVRDALPRAAATARRVLGELTDPLPVEEVRGCTS